MAAAMMQKTSSSMLATRAQRPRVAGRTVVKAQATDKLWVPGAARPSYLDGKSLAGDYGFDPMGFGADPRGQQRRARVQGLCEASSAAEGGREGGRRRGSEGLADKTPGTVLGTRARALPTLPSSESAAAAVHQPRGAATDAVPCGRTRRPTPSHRGAALPCSAATLLNTAQCGEVGVLHLLPFPACDAPALEAARRSSVPVPPLPATEPGPSLRTRATRAPAGSAVPNPPAAPALPAPMAAARQDLGPAGDRRFR
eukprot:362231-Chlamydomonas_euryale.AAC.6